ncbi:MAG: hypothetical protein J6B33_02135 [Prevotella sp.]|nr:hypothetical protein [Prevotella sp.]
MKVALLYIGVGRYSCFWEEFYNTCERNFLPEAEKHYFFATDMEAQLKVGNNVTLIHQEDLGWPCNTMYRFMFFLRVKEELRNYDYIYFCNANTRFKAPITPQEIVPTNEDGGLLMLTWQDMNADPDTFPFERRPQSAACVPFGTRQIYYQGTLNGGSCEEFIKLLEGCHEIVDRDFHNGYVPTAHDESALNAYMQGRKCKLVDSTYGRPEHRDKRHTAKIVFATKEKVLGRSYMRHFKKRGHSDTWLRKLLKKMGLIH